MMKKLNLLLLVLLLTGCAIHKILKNGYSAEQNQSVIGYQVNQSPKSNSLSIYDKPKENLGISVNKTIEDTFFHDSPNEEDRDLWEFIHSEYLLLKGNKNPTQPLQLREGDYFGNLKLEQLWSSLITFVNGEAMYARGVGDFTGNLTITGDFIIENGPFANEFPNMFHIYPQYIHLFPRLWYGNKEMNEDISLRFEVSNEAEFFKLMNLSPAVYPLSFYSNPSNTEASIVFSDVHVRIDSLRLVWMDNGGLSQIHIAEVLSGPR